MLDKYGNDLDYWYYCPICGDSFLPSFVHCDKHKKVKLVQSLHTKEYYQDISYNRNNIYGSGFDILKELEIEPNPLYNSDENAKIPAPIQIDKLNKNQDLNKPKCPTCQSENVKKISVAKKATHGFMFGIFSKTAFSQFECCSCGYKW